MRRRRGLIFVLLGLLAIILLALHAVNVVVAEAYCCHESESLAMARERGVLVKELEVACPAVVWEGTEYRVKEVWIERVMRVDYDWLFIRHDIPVGYAIVARFDLAPGQRLDLPYGVQDDPLLVYADSIPIGTTSGDARFTGIRPPFPDSVCLKVVPREQTIDRRQSAVRDSVAKTAGEGT